LLPSALAIIGSFAFGTVGWALAVRCARRGDLRDTRLGPTQPGTKLLRMTRLLIRDGTPEDFERVNDIYNWTIVNNHVSFDTEPWDVERRERWWADRPDDLDVLVAEIDGYVVGVSYSSFYRPKPAYRTTAETTVVLDIDYLQQGIGTALLGAVAIVALPNEASIAAHQKLGYRVVGTISEVGYKMGRYWDTTLLEADLTI
jgi:phosphinothricin acetyltransferase